MARHFIMMPRELTIKAKRRDTIIKKKHNFAFAYGIRSATYIS